MRLRNCARYADVQLAKPATPARHGTESAEIRDPRLAPDHRKVPLSDTGTMRWSRPLNAARLILPHNGPAASRLARLPGSGVFASPVCACSKHTISPITKISGARETQIRPDHNPALAIERRASTPLKRLPEPDDVTPAAPDYRA